MQFGKIMFTIGLSIWMAGSALAADPAITCQATKNQISGKYAACLQKAQAGLVKNGDSIKYAEAASKCLTKFTDAWSKAETKAADGGLPCVDTHVVPTPVVTFIDDCMDCVASQLLNGIPGACKCQICEAGGVPVGGACWYFGASNESCDTTCAAAGLVYDDSTLVYAGSAGASFAQCDQVLSALGAPATTFGDGTCANALGCFYQNAGAGRVRCTSPDTTSSGVTLTGQRACACQ